MKGMRVKEIAKLKVEGVGNTNRLRQFDVNDTFMSNSTRKTQCVSIKS